MAVTGMVSLKLGSQHYSLEFKQNGWLAAELVQYLGDVYRSPDAETAILQLLGYTMTLSSQAPSRRFDHWVEIDLEQRLLVTNSDVIRKAVDQQPAQPDDPFGDLSLREIYRTLDEHDFTVKLLK